MDVPGRRPPEAGKLTIDDLNRALEYFATSDPGADAFAFDLKTRQSRPLTPELAAIFNTAHEVDQFSDLVGSHALAELLAAWDRAKSNGGSRVLLPRAGQDSVRTWWSFVHVPGKRDLMVVVIGTQAPAESTKYLAPRQCQLLSDAAAVITFADEAACAMLGYSAEEMINKTSLQFLHPDYHESAIESWIEMLDAPGKSLRTTVRLVRSNGEAFWAEITTVNRLHDLGVIERQVLDVDERIGAQLEAGKKDKVIRSIADVLPNGIAQFDVEWNLVFANDRWLEITGTDASSSLSDYQNLLIEPEAEGLYRQGITHLVTHGSFDAEATITPNDGASIRRCRLSLRSIDDDDGNVTGYVACLDDITIGWRMQQRLVEQATKDHLTGLLNRTAIEEHLEALLHSARGSNSLSAAIFVDLNEFKRVNDVLGHSAGDTLLREISSKVCAAVRPGDVVARQGGDEFLVICADLKSATEAMQVARSVINSICGHYKVNGEIIEASASCGVALDTGGRHTAERLIAEADLAMYQRKRSRDRTPGLFEPSMFDEQRDQLNRDTALAQAVGDGSLVLHYQPIVNISTARTVGYEALIRWQFRDTLVYPDQFIGLAEHRGLIPGIGEWVLNEVCRVASLDPRSGIVWSLNVSPLQLRDAAFDGTVAKALDKYGVRPAQLALELTEGVMMTTDKSTINLLHRLHEMGVKLVVDDFGTGFASLDYLRTFPVSGLKLDRCFTADIERERTCSIVTNVVNLADTLGLHLVVEGIETATQASEVASTGARVGQGYLFGRPTDRFPATGKADAKKVSSPADALLIS